MDKLKEAEIKAYDEGEDIDFREFSDEERAWQNAKLNIEKGLETKKDMLEKLPVEIEIDECVKEFVQSKIDTFNDGA